MAESDAAAGNGSIKLHDTVPEPGLPNISLRHTSRDISLLTVCELIVKFCNNDDIVSAMAVMVKVAHSSLCEAVILYIPVCVPRVNSRVAVPFMVLVLVDANPCPCQLTIAGTGFPCESYSPIVRGSRVFTLAVEGTYPVDIVVATPAVDVIVHVAVQPLTHAFTR
jgi:hypothetical protein